MTFKNFTGLKKEVQFKCSRVTFNPGTGTDGDWDLTCIPKKLEGATVADTAAAAKHGGESKRVAEGHFAKYGPVRWASAVCASQARAMNEDFVALSRGEIPRRLPGGPGSLGLLDLIPEDLSRGFNLPRRCNGGWTLPDL